MRTLVTGAAGFIGSHLVDALLERGDTVIGIDCFTDYYDVAAKEANLLGATGRPGFELLRADISAAPLDEVVCEVDTVFHLAAQPGVRLSWSDGFPTYNRHNILATQRLLEAVRGSKVDRIVFASSSSVYGNAKRYPCTENDLPKPFSPYGVTKLAAEQLCRAYGENFAVPTISLRYFTVYGPRQRPDMAFHRLIDAALAGRPFPLYGDGSQIRDFTYVDDVVAANLAAADADVEPGAMCNIAGGDSTTLNDVIALIENLTGAGIALDHKDAAAGDVHRTGGDISWAGDHLGWQPAIGTRSGLRQQIDWHRDRTAS